MNGAVKLKQAATKSPLWHKRSNRDQLTQRTIARLKDQPAIMAAGTKAGKR